MNRGNDGEGVPSLRVVERVDQNPMNPGTLPRLILWKRDLCQILGVGLRTLERMISAGEIPPPNRRMRGRPTWLAASINEWAENGCPNCGPFHH